MVNILETIRDGVINHPSGRLQTATFTYSDGSQLTLSGESLELWSMLYRTLIMYMQQPRPSVPSMTIDDLRNRSKEE